MSMFANESAPPIVLVERILFAKVGESFAVVAVRPEAGGEGFVAAGPMPLGVAVGDALKLEGEFEDHPRFGRRYKVSLAHPVRPVSVEGIRRYLKSGRVRGIGKKLAERIVDHFGPDTLQILEDFPERLAEVPGVGKQRLASLAEDAKDTKAEREHLVQLTSLGLSPVRAQELLRQLGEDTALAKLAKDPYAFVGRLPRFGFQTADQIAKGLGLTDGSPNRLAALLVHTLEQALTQGHLHLGLNELLRAAQATIEAKTEVLLAAVQSAVHSGRLAAVCPDLPPFAEIGPPRIYLPAVLNEEATAAEALLALQAAEEPRLVPAPPTLDLPSLKLSEEQEAAVRAILAARVAVLTGGPGVGKTTVLKAIVRAWVSQGLVVTLTAPTGRAARRLAEATGSPAATLHKTLAIRPGVREHKDAPPFKTDALVIDEASMLDLPLFAAVLRRLQLGTLLLLVGDQDQLPSVGPGDVLRDILKSARIPVVRLTKVFRQALDSHIVRNAHRVLNGQLPSFPPRGEDSDCFFAEREDSAAGANLVRQLVLDRIPKRFGFDPEKEVQVLSPMHRGACGVRALNQLLQSTFSAGRPSLDFGEQRYFLGDRVMQTRNDHDRELMNGEIGTISKIDAASGRLEVSFEDRKLDYAGGEISDLTLAWATTVHKAQGAEFPAVILTLFREHHLMLRRAILYTAMTRARRLLVLVASQKALEAAVKDARAISRRSEFAHRLMGHRILPVPADQLSAE